MPDVKPDRLLIVFEDVSGKSIVLTYSRSDQGRPDATTPVVLVDGLGYEVLPIDCTDVQVSKPLFSIAGDVNIRLGEHESELGEDRDSTGIPGHIEPDAVP